MTPQHHSTLLSFLRLSVWDARLLRHDDRADLVDWSRCLAEFWYFGIHDEDVWLYSMDLR